MTETENNKFVPTISTYTNRVEVAALNLRDAMGELIDADTFQMVDTTQRHIVQLRIEQLDDRLAKLTTFLAK